MAKRKDAAAAAAKNEAPPTPETPKIEPAAEAPKIEAATEAPNVELPNVESPSVDPLKAETAETAASETPAVAVNVPALIPLVVKSRARTRRYALLAASVALAAAIGAIVGAGVTIAFSNQAPAVDAAAAAQTRALKDNVARLSGELWTVKAGIESANKSSASQFSKLADRLDRAEKAQAEPAAKLVKIMESLDRLEHRPQTAAATTDVTGSITTVEKEQSKPPVIDGWRLVDFYAGRAVLENRAGALFEVAPGANLPGVGKVESVKREDRRVVVTTAKGIIAANFEQRRPPYYLPPYRY